MTSFMELMSCFPYLTVFAEAWPWPTSLIVYQLVANQWPNKVAKFLITLIMPQKALPLIISSPIDAIWYQTCPCFLLYYFSATKNSAQSFMQLNMNSMQTCNSITSYFMKKLIFWVSGISRKRILPNIFRAGTVKLVNFMTDYTRKQSWLCQQ